jgi:hypothetical protein
MILDSWLQMKPLLIVFTVTIDDGHGRTAGRKVAVSQLLLKAGWQLFWNLPPLTASFNKESFLRKLLRWVITMISRSTPLITFGFEIWCDSLADFGCLQTVKGSIMDNYKAYKGIVTEKLRATLGKIDISFRFSKDSTKTSNTSEWRIFYRYRLAARVSLRSLHWLR